MHRRIFILLIATFFSCAPAARADYLKLKDGSTVEGVIIKFGDTYRVKTADGQTQVISADQVDSVNKGSAPVNPKAVTGPVNTTGLFAATKSRADAVDAPIIAVTIWEKFIDDNPTSTDLPAAKTELAKWQKLNQGNAERINGKWVGGEERHKIISQVNKLCSEARQQLDTQTLQAIQKYEQALKLYPNCFEANFALGYFYLNKGAVGSTGRGDPAELDRAIRLLENALHLDPKSPEAMSNLALGYAVRQRWKDAVMMAYKSVQQEDNQELADNFVNILVESPPGLKRSGPQMQPVIEEAALLAQKYHIPSTGNDHLHYLAPKPHADDQGAGADDGPAGIVGNGSGFLISSDGYIITNRHVVNDKNHFFRVRFDDGTEKAADVVAIDTDLDIALLKIKSDSPLPFLKIASANLPNPAAQCMVLGYPVADMLDFKMQVTSGEVTSTDEADPYQVTLTANTTHGNSGGPIVDRDGNVIGVLSAGEQAYNVTYVKALSAGQIHAFLDRVKDKITAKIDPGAVNPASTFDGEKLAQQARKATLLVLIIRGDGKDSSPQN